ncbi:hypothetical protein CBM2626_U30025 [Cupriavidus taiwanensis]|nr:hypothetical protein CBM2626_U30025 [Cupriavidus taiwanensis]
MPRTDRGEAGRHPPLPPLTQRSPKTEMVGVGSRKTKLDPIRPQAMHAYSPGGNLKAVVRRVATNPPHAPPPHRSHLGT